MDGKCLSWTQLRVFCDASGLPIFELHRERFGVTWFAQLPGGGSPPLVTIAPKWRFFKDKFDIHVHNAAADGADVVLEARGQDIWKSITHVYFNDDLVMKSRGEGGLWGGLEKNLGIGRAEWEVEVAQGMDLSLVWNYFAPLPNTKSDGV